MSCSLNLWTGFARCTVYSLLGNEMMARAKYIRSQFGPLVALSFLSCRLTHSGRQQPHNSNLLDPLEMKSSWI